MPAILEPARNQAVVLSPRRPGGEDRVRGANELVHAPTHLTLPPRRDGPLPLPPEGRRGDFRMRPEMYV